MSHTPSRLQPGRRDAGFTLVELITVVVLLSVAAATLMKIQSNLFAQRAGVDTTQVYSQLQLACAEQVLNVVRLDGIDQVTNVSTAQGGSGRFGPNLCDNITAYRGNPIPSVTVNDSYTGTGCPAGITCKLVTVQEGSLQPLVFMLSNY